jgi:hypothetical protein
LPLFMSSGNSGNSRRLSCFGVRASWVDEMDERAVRV